MNTELKATSQLHGFARRLVAEGLMDEQAAIHAGLEAGKEGRTILAWLNGNGEVDPEALTAAASVEYGVPFIDIRAVDLSNAPVSLVNDTQVRC